MSSACIYKMDSAQKQSLKLCGERNRLFSYLASCSMAMMMSRRGEIAMWVVALMFVASQTTAVCGQLSPSFYDEKCPKLKSIVDDVLKQATYSDPRVPARLLRVHFHDCFAQGCDGSVLLDDIKNFQGEKTAVPNRNSLKGFEVIDAIKSAVEAACPEVVSCADIVALAAEVSVVQSGGPSWEVQLGRRDSRTASKRIANNDIPPPTSNVSALIAAFQKKGLSAEDMVVLSGAHTIGVSRCVSFTPRLYNQSGTLRPDSTLETSYLTKLKQVCPQNGDGNVTQSLDIISPARFDTKYYQLLQRNLGLLNSDQVLTTQSTYTSSLVNNFAFSEISFFEKFAASMINLGNIQPLTGSQGEIRKQCRFRN